MPLLPAVIGAAGAIGGGLLAKGANYAGPNATQQSDTNLTLGNLNQATSGANALVPRGLNLLDTSTNLFAGLPGKLESGTALPLDYFSSILKGGVPAFQAIAPQVNQANAATAANNNALAQLAPRSGAAPDLKAASIYQPQKTITSLLQTAQPEAAKQVADIIQKNIAQEAGIAGAEGSLGSYVSGQGLQTLLSAASGGTQQFLAQLQQQINQQKQQAALGSSVGSLLQLLTKGMQKGSGSSGNILLEE